MDSNVYKDQEMQNQMFFFPLVRSACLFIIMRRVNRHVQNGARCPTITPAIFVRGYLTLAMGMGSNEHTMLNVRNIGRGHIKGIWVMKWLLHD